MPDYNFSFIKNTNLKVINAWWLKLTGNRSEFPLERRIFHSLCIGLILLTVLYVPYNLYAGLYVASASALIVGLFFSFQFYNSRYHNKPHNSTVFGIMGILIFGINYFYNSGIQGSTDLIWPAYLLLIFAISPYRQHLTWLLVYIGCFLLLHTIEYYYPFLVVHPFDVGSGQFIDRITAFPMPAVATYIIIKFIRRSYDRERKIAEEKTIAAQTLMSIISHDLRTPLTNVQGYLALLDGYALDSAERPALESALLKSTNDAMEMLSNLLHWSKSQMDGPYVQLKKVNLFAILRATLEMEQGLALKKNISLSYDIPADLEVTADIDMLQLVVRNLISNAVKFTPRDGLIHVEAQLVSAECRIAVRDNGKGIALEKQAKLFSAKPVPEFGTNNERGVGLGLILCKEFIGRQGGHINFESVPGKGSTFFIYLPVIS